jgi:hypothetical protein
MSGEEGSSLEHVGSDMAKVGSGCQQRIWSVMVN